MSTSKLIKDPLFKIKQVFGSIDNFLSTMHDHIEGFVVQISPENITLDLLSKTKEFKKFMKENSISNMSAGKVVAMIKEEFEKYLKKT